MHVSDSISHWAVSNSEASPSMEHCHLNCPITMSPSIPAAGSTLLTRRQAFFPSRSGVCRSSGRPSYSKRVFRQGCVGTSLSTVCNTEGCLSCHAAMLILALKSQPCVQYVGHEGLLVKLSDESLISVGYAAASTGVKTLATFYIHRACIVLAWPRLRILDHEYELGSACISILLYL